MRNLLLAPKLLRHRLILGMLYGCGLRCFELRRLHIKDVDFDRLMVHVRKGKGRKDRYLPLSKHLARGLKTYIDNEHPQLWLFNGKNAEGRIVALSQRGVQWIVRESRKTAGLEKEVTAHTLRHTFATHLLEDGHRDAAWISSASKTCSDMLTWKLRSSISMYLRWEDAGRLVLWIRSTLISSASQT